MGNLEEQKEEMEVLRSIFGEEVLIHQDEASEGQFLAHPVLPQPFSIISYPPGGVKQEVKVEFLPPIIFHFRLPVEYPSTLSPVFVLSCQWLTRAQLSHLCSHLDNLWLECKPEVVLFRWFQFLQENALAHLGISNLLDITPLVLSCTSMGKVPNFGNLSQALRGMSSVPVQPEEERASKVDKKKVPISPRKQIKNHLGKNKPVQEIPKERGRGRGRKQLPINQQSSSSPLNVSNQGQDPSINELPSCDFVLSDVELLQKLHLNPSSSSMKDLNVDISKEDPRAAVDLKPGVTPLPIIVDFNELKQKDAFNREWFTCKVCLSERLGHQCLQFVGCRHIFCKSCMQGYFEVQIKEGNVRLLTCPEDKCSSQAIPAQVYELVGPELFSRYDSILLESSLAQMGDVTHCPRTSCQFVVIKDGCETFSTCLRCQFVFCNFCRRTYHGVAPCRLKNDDKREIIKQYQNGGNDVKLELEKRYGKKHLLTMIEEFRSEVWIQDCTKKCPHCCASIQKSDGCNKMICWRCNTFFCWLCERPLNAASPYTHFNDTKSKCYNLLFEGADDNEDDEDWEFEL